MHANAHAVLIAAEVDWLEGLQLLAGHVNGLALARPMCHAVHKWLALRNMAAGFYNMLEATSAGGGAVNSTSTAGKQASGASFTNNNALALQGSASKASMPRLHPALNRQLLCDTVDQGAFGVATWLGNQGIVLHKSPCKVLEAHAAIKASRKVLHTQELQSSCIIAHLHAQGIVLQTLCACIGFCHPDAHLKFSVEDRHHTMAREAG
jgi:hypothetical protein